MAILANPLGALAVLDATAKGGLRSPVSDDSGHALGLGSLCALIPWACSIRKTECTDAKATTRSNEPGSPCTQLDEVECDSIDGTLLRVRSQELFGDCDWHCICEHVDARGQTVWEEI